MDVHQHGHGLHEGVAEPLRQLVERYDGLPLGAIRVARHGGEGPGVAEADSVDYGAGGGPDRSEPVHEHVPQGWEGDDGDGGDLGGWVGNQVIWEELVIVLL